MPAPDTNSTTYIESPVPESPSPSGGLEESTESWRPSHAALTFVPGRKGQAIRVTRKGGGETFAFYAAKRPVTKKVGEPFNARAYVRTTSPGMYVCLRVQEHGGGVPTTTERCAAAKSGWRRVALRGKSIGKGHRLVFSLHVMAALGGTSFDVEGFRLG
jgi:hypothetical protein